MFRFIYHTGADIGGFVYGLLTKPVVKMAGYIMAKFFFACLSVDVDSVSVDKYARSMITWPVSRHLGLTLGKKTHTHSLVKCRKSVYKGYEISRPRDQESN